MDEHAEGAAQGRVSRRHVLKLGAAGAGLAGLAPASLTPAFATRPLVATGSTLTIGVSYSFPLTRDGMTIALGTRERAALLATGARAVRLGFQLRDYPRWDDSIVARYEDVVCWLEQHNITIV